MIVIAGALLCAFSALMGFDIPAPPVPVHAAWADALMPAVALAVAIMAARGQLRLSTVGGALWPAIAYVAWAGLSAWRNGGIVKVAGLVELVCVMMAAAALTTWRVRIMQAWIAAAALISTVGIVVGAAAQLGFDPTPLHLGAGELGWRFRPAGLARVGLVAELALVPFLAVLGHGDRLVGRFRRPLLVLFALTLVLGATRTLLAAALGFIVLRRRQAAPAAAAVLAILAIASMRLDVHGKGAGIRWRIADSAKETVRAQPLYGVGPNGTVAVAGWPGAEDEPRAWDAHSTLLNVAASYGLPALLAFVLCWLLVLRAAHGASGDALQAVLVAGLWATTLDMITVDVEDFRHVWLLAGLSAIKI